MMPFIVVHTGVNLVFEKLELYQTVLKYWFASSRLSAYAAPAAL
jgi:hypothetical protein